jgi:hypothetical protein
MPNIILRTKKEKAPERKPPSLEDSYKAEVRLKLLKTRLKAIASLIEPNMLKDLTENNGNVVDDDALANQIFKNEFAATLGHRLGDKVKISEESNEAWKNLLLMLKIAERKYGLDHPWTQVVFETICNVAKKRAYHSIRGEDTQVEIAKMPLDLLMPQWRRRRTDLGQ